MSHSSSTGHRRSRGDTCRARESRSSPVKVDEVQAGLPVDPDLGPSRRDRRPDVARAGVGLSVRRPAPDGQRPGLRSDGPDLRARRRGQPGDRQGDRAGVGQTAGRAFAGRSTAGPLDDRRNRRHEHWERRPKDGAMDLVDDEERDRLIAEVEYLPPGLDLLVHSCGDDRASGRGRRHRRGLRPPVQGQSARSVRADQGTPAQPAAESRTGRLRQFECGPRSHGRTRASTRPTQAGLRSLSTSLRDEVNQAGIRVTTIFPGRTATPRQEMIHAWEGKAYRPDRLLQPEDVAAMVVAPISLPGRRR